MITTIIGSSLIHYTPKPIDSYLVIVKNKNDWEEIHNFLINETEVEHIPNRNVECENTQNHSPRSSIYSLKIEEIEELRNHPKIENIILNPEHYPQPASTTDLRYKKNIAISKPNVSGAGLTGNYFPEFLNTTYTNNVRSNWAHQFMVNYTGSEYRGVGIATTTLYNSDEVYSLTGKGVDAVIIDSGVCPIHPDFLNIDGTTRVRDLILDGPYVVDSNYFIGIGATYIKIVDGVNIGVGINTTSAINWWGNTNNRSAKFSNLGTITIPATYTLGQATSKNDGTNPILNGHGTSCASQIGGNTFGLATEANLYSIRGNLGSGYGGTLDTSIGLNACAIFHQAKNISQNGNPNPTIINNSYQYNNLFGNALNGKYYVFYRNVNYFYTGTGNLNNKPVNSFFATNHANVVFNTSSGIKNLYYSSNGVNGLGYFQGNGFGNTYDPYGAVSLGAENAIDAGCIVVAAAGNMNQKLSNSIDIDYYNQYSASGISGQYYYTNRVFGIQKGTINNGSEYHGTIRVGAIDCALEPAGQRQGSPAYLIRKSAYSNNGPMIDVWAPGEMTMAATYANINDGVSFPRQDNSNFYDTYFNGTSSASPNTCSLLCLYLQTNRSANQGVVRNWLWNVGSKTVPISDPYPNPNDANYWSQNYNATTDYPDKYGDSYNWKGDGNLRGAVPRVLQNPFANNTKTTISGSGLNITGISFTKQ